MNPPEQEVKTSDFNTMDGYLICKMCNLIYTLDESKWCNHIQVAFMSNLDAEGIKPGDTIRVPISPQAQIWATVKIDEHIYSGGAALMQMHYQPQFGSLKKIEIGFWNPGEGRRVMRACIVDYIKSQCHPDEELTSAPILTRCPTDFHGIPARKYANDICDNSVLKWKYLWNIVLEHACTYCIQHTDDSDTLSLDGPITAVPWKNSPFPANTTFTFTWSMDAT